MMKNFCRTLINIVIVVMLFSSITIITAQETNCNYLSGNLLREISPTIVRLTNGVGEQGSGVIISPDGVIITASHVVRDSDTIQVAILTDTSQSPVNQYIAEVVHVDVIPDFAILRITRDINNQPVESLSVSSIPVSQETLYFGDCATVLGYSLAANSTLIPSDGRISQPIERRLNNGSFHISTITGSFTRGQSGGAVLDSNGILYGIATEFVDNGQFGYIISMGEICLLVPSICASLPQQLFIVAPGDYQPTVGCPHEWMPNCPNTRLYDYDNNGTYTWSTNNIPVGDWEVKIALNGDWQENYGADGIRDGANIPFTVSQPGSLVVFLYYPSTYMLRIIVEQEPSLVVFPGDFQSELSCDVNMGYFGDWAPECLHSRAQDLDGDGIYIWTTTQIPMGNWEVKVALNGSWDENYGLYGVPEGDNIPFTVSTNNAQMTFTYNSRTYQITITEG